MQAVADLLRAGVIGDEYRHAAAGFQQGPVGLRGAADFLVFIKAADIRGHKTGGLRQHLADGATADGFDRDIGCRVGCRADVDAGLLPQTVHQLGQGRAEGRRRRTDDAHADGAFETGENGQLFTAFHTERQLDEIK